jgi:hypothetical protein
MSTLAESWFAESVKLEIGQSLMVQVLSKKEQTQFANEMEEEKTGYAMIEPVHASQLNIFKTRKDSRFWVVVQRKDRATFKGLIKDIDGTYREISIDPERRRMITLMLKDGYKKTQIENTLEGLTEDEDKEFFPV